MPAREKQWWEYIADFMRPTIDFATMGLAEAPGIGIYNHLDNWRNSEEEGIQSALSGATSDATGAQGQIASNGWHVTPEVEKYIDNLISQQNTSSAQQWEEHMRDSDTLSQGEQLKQLGLSSSGVLDIGGASHGSIQAADNSKTNMALDRYAQRMSMAKQLLGMTSQMASAGIYGNAIGAAKKASSIMTSSASHSALNVLRSRK